MSRNAPAPFLRDPVTVPRQELIEHYRAQAGRYRQLAERQQRSSVHQGLLDLARQCEVMAGTLEMPEAARSAKPELGREELLLMLSQVVAEAAKSERKVPVAAPSDPPALRDAARELSLDEILQKVQRDIAEGRPAAPGDSYRYSGADRLREAS